ncbi:MAG: DNA repair protein RadC [Methanosarcinaceae archaeon]|nr:DNA repair protein RadC [Methanosarcinaceae archaeon]
MTNITDITEKEKCDNKNKYISGNSSNHINGNNSIKIREIAVHDRPQERLKARGAESLSDAELLAVIIRTGTRKENVIDMCRRILAEYSLSQLSSADYSELMKIHGIGEVKAAQIIAVFEISRRLETFSSAPKRRIVTPNDVFQYIYPDLREKKREKFIAIYLDTKNGILKKRIISIGSLNTSIVHPREVFKSAFLESAASIILVHNHPSGDPTPSPEDIEITIKLNEVGKIMGFSILDHIIVGDKKFVSLKQLGYF